MRRILLFSVPALAVVAAVVVAAVNLVGQPQVLKSKRYCYVTGSICLTVPQVSSKSFITTHKEADWTHLDVTNIFNRKRGKFFPCKERCGGDTVGMTIYKLSVRKNSFNTEWDVARISFSEGFRCDSTEYGETAINRIAAKTVTCSGYKLFDNTGEVANRASQKYVIWRHRGMTYTLCLYEEGQHPPARWKATLESISLN